jgi:hypothetical protein
MPAAGTHVPVATALRGHDLEIALIDAIRAADVASASFPPFEHRGPLGFFRRRNRSQPNLCRSDLRSAGQSLQLPHIKETPIKETPRIIMYLT